MNMPFPSTPRLTDDDLDRLHDLLEQRAVPHDGMSLEMLDGFLSALVIGPETVEFDEYSPLIWNHEVQWDSPAEQREAVRLIGCLWSDIVTRINLDLPEDDDDSPEAAEQIEAAMPLLALPDLSDSDDPEQAVADIPTDYPAAAAWAFGFMQGVGLRSEAWTLWEQEDEQVADDLRTIAELTVLSPEQAEELGMEEQGVPDFAARMGIAGALPVILQNFHVYRMEQLSPDPAQRAEGPGRNDPCPCGSGRKFKKCCGDPARLN